MPIAVLFVGISVGAVFAVMLFDASSRDYRNPWAWVATLLACGCFGWLAVGFIGPRQKSEKVGEVHFIELADGSEVAVAAFKLDDGAISVLNVTSQFGSFPPRGSTVRMTKFGWMYAGIHPQDDKVSYDLLPPTEKGDK